jgi:cation transport regulator ChaC
MNIKRLELDGWMKSKRGFEQTINSGEYTQIDPKLNRNGWFLQGKDCWFEINGCAYTCPRKMFDYTFKILEVRELSQLETNALKAIVDVGFATPKQKEMHIFHVLHGNKFNVNEARRKKRLKEIKQRMKEKREAAALI